MSTTPDAGTRLKQIDKTFLRTLKIGDRLFHYPTKGNAAESFEESPSAEYMLYSVIDIPGKNEITLIGTFDEGEIKRSYDPSELLSGAWWYNPDFK